MKPIPKTTIITGKDIKKAKSIGCKIFLITSAKKSTIKKMSDFYVEIKTPTKNDISKSLNESLYDRASKMQKSVQPMSSLFDQALHIYGDIVSLEIIEIVTLAFENLQTN